LLQVQNSKRTDLKLVQIVVDGESLSLADVVSGSRDRDVTIRIAPGALKKVERCRETITKILQSEGASVYGVNTGFGPLSRKKVEDLEGLQRNLILCCCVGVGNSLREEFVRAIMLIRINTLAKGYSGIRTITLEKLVDMLNLGINPIIPEKGSVCASGDLAPLSYIALALIGDKDAEVSFKGRRMPATEAMKEANIEPVQLQAKEGLALNNGTAASTGIAVLTVYDALNLLKISDIAGALSLEGLRSVKKPFDERIHTARGHIGQIECAHNLRLLLKDSRLCQEYSSQKVHDAYSLRCIPQIHGAVRDAMRYVKGVIETEINAATDNPLIFSDGDVISGGNFHGQPVSIAMDTCAISLSTLANVSERRTARLIDQGLNKIKRPTYPVDLPDFLIDESKLGLHSGYMMAQYTCAALASENKVLSHPASVDTIPTSANFEDHVSMGMHGAIKAHEVKENLESVLAIELICAAQAIDFSGAENLGEGTSEAYKIIRRHIQFLSEDRILSKDIQSMSELIHNGSFLSNLEEKMGHLN
jgi:histidine ammonia-lyase